MDTTADLLITPEIKLPLLHVGKVRYVYEVDSNHLLMVTTDKISAYDVVLPTPIPGKGRILNALSLFWFNQFQSLVPNHISSLKPEDVLNKDECTPAILARSVVVKRLQAIPYEAVVRGYLFGSLWQSYQDWQVQKDRCLLGDKLRHVAELPAGMVQAQKLPQPLFTPTTKAEVGGHDEPVAYEDMCQVCGREVIDHMRRVSLAIYERAFAYAEKGSNGILIADTKLEFGLDNLGQVVLMDELLTPDSSRLWDKTHYQVGTSPRSFDKQYIRDWLHKKDWQTSQPPPVIDQAVVNATRKKYNEALNKIEKSVPLLHL